MNASKTKAVWVGNKKYSDLILCPESNLYWSHSNFKLLGIEFSIDLNRITEINFLKKIKEVSAILKSWQHRKLTLMEENYSYKISCFLKISSLTDCIAKPNTV